ncbi:MAG TPA: type II toxin-antitoxin system Phd/YefM family antitoxin [Acidobacteriaceae bacterium]|jgi:prevent-host-death family protein
MTTWHATKAKAQLGTVMDRAASEGPQRITRRGAVSFILVTEEQWKSRITSKENLAEFLLNSPLRGSGIKLERIKGGLREVDFG